MDVKKLLLTLVLGVVTVSISYAQTGRIAGQVTDAETGEPLPGVNVVIEGTTQGTTTDVDGEYSIINVDPGTYSLRATFVGYAPIVVEDVEVDIDLTTTIDLQMQEQTAQLDEVVVRAQTPIVQRDVSGSQANIDPAEIEAARFQTISDVIGSEVGVRAIGPYDNRPEFRGSDVDEVDFIVDGISTKDPLSNRPSFSVNLDAIQQVQLQTGGFSAEYGNMRAGVVSVVTREGGEEYSGSLDMRYSPPGLKHHGPMLYSFDAPHVAPFVKEEEGAFTGNDFFDGWIAEANSLEQGQPHAGEPMELYARYLWRHRSPEALQELRRLEREGEVNIEWGQDGPPEEAFHNYGDRPDYYASATFGGPIPVIPANFFVAYNQEFLEYQNQLSDLDGFKDHDFRAKVTGNPVESVKLALTYSNNNQRGSSGGNSSVLDYVSRDPFLQFNTPNKLWYPHCEPVVQMRRQTAGIRMTHTLSSDTFYDLHLIHKRMDQATIESAPRQTAPVPGTSFTSSSDQAGLEEGRLGDEARIQDMIDNGVEGWENWRDWAKVKIGDYWYDEAPKGYGPVNWRDVTGYYRMESCVLPENDTFTRTYAANGTFTSQISQRNQVRAGFEVERLRVNQDYRFIDPSVNAGFYDQSDVTPWQGAFFVTDKLEFEGLVANLGLRADWIMHGRFPVLDGPADDNVSGPYSDYLLAGNSDDLLDEVPQKRVSQTRLSPRLGISHPISTVAKIFFNYGHFYQWPSHFFSYQIRRNVAAGNRISDFGNPRLAPPRTIAYELGYEHNLFDRISLRATGYYKDINGDLDDVDFNFLAGGDYETQDNMVFRDIRGLEARAHLRRGSIPYFSGWASVDYMIESAGVYGFDEFYEDTRRQPDEVSTQVSNPDVRPLVKLNTDFHTPDEFGPSWGGVAPLGGINLSLIYTWHRGQQFTWNPEGFPLVEDNVRWANYSRWDLRFRKPFFSAGGFESVFYIDVTNLFNQRHLTSPFEGGGVGNVAWDGHLFWNNEFRSYMESLDLTVNEDGSIQGGDRPGDWEGDHIDLPAFTPRSFLERRDIYFGVKLQF